MTNQITPDNLDGLLPLVRSLVYSKFRTPYSDDADDLIQVGVLGALEAIERFDPDCGTKLSSFIYFRAHGAIQDYLRRQQPGPRRDPHRYKMLSLDGLNEAAETTWLESIADEPLPERDPYLRGLLAEAMQSLSEEARIALFLAYGDDQKWTRKEIGKQLGRSEAAAYQLIHYGIKKLRAHPALRDYAPTG